MKNTKQRIKDKARELFNQQGLSDTSLRNIAGELGMSQGNLNYHYKVKEDLVTALYFELVSKMNEKMATMTAASSILDSLYRSSQTMSFVFYDYRFLLKDLYKIFLKNSTIKEHYIQLQVIRKKQFLQIFEDLIAANLMRKEEISKEYDNLYLRMQILGDNWINAQETLNNTIKDPVLYYNYIMIEMLYPYLTDKGKKEFLLLRE